MLVFQYFVYRFQLFHVWVLFQFGRQAVQLFSGSYLFDLRFAFVVDLHIDFHAFYFFGGQVRSDFFDQFRFHAPCQTGDVSVTGVACQVLQGDGNGFLFTFLSLCTKFLALFQELLQELIAFEQFLVGLPAQRDKAVAHQ